MNAIPISVVLADDHPVFRDGLRALFASRDEVEVVGEAADGAEAVALAQRLKPDVVVLDLQMPVLNGIEAARQIAVAQPECAVLVLTMFEDDDSVFAAIRAGARGYVLKGAAQDEILRALQAVASGEAIFSPAIAQRVIQYFTAGDGDQPPRPFPELTDREREVLDLIAAGHANPEIARRLEVTPKTVRNHVSNILTKLRVPGRGQAIVRAREAGLGGEK